MIILHFRREHSLPRKDRAESKNVEFEMPVAGVGTDMRPVLVDAV